MQICLSTLTNCCLKWFQIKCVLKFPSISVSFSLYCLYLLQIFAFPIFQYQRISLLRCLCYLFASMVIINRYLKNIPISIILIYGLNYIIHFTHSVFSWLTLILEWSGINEVWIHPTIVSCLLMKIEYIKFFFFFLNSLVLES